MEVIDCAKLKKNSLVFYKRFIGRRYNKKSLNNLKQNTQKDEEKNSFLTILKKQKEVDCISTYASNYKTAFKSATQKEFKEFYSKSQTNKICEITNVFIQSLLSKYSSNLGFSQRSVSFVTITLPSTQMHTDKEIIKTFVRFVNHLKKVKNYIIENGVQTKKEAMQVENYVWRAETQENGNLHFHLLFDTYFNHHTLKRVWNNYLKDMGYSGGEKSASIHAIKNLNDVGAYVTKYMTKEPLKDKYKKMLDNRQISKKDLQNLSNDEKYRRPVIGKVWGCSKKILKLSYLTCYDYEIAQMNEVVEHMEEYKNSTLPDYVKVFTGNVKSILKKCSYRLQKWVRGYYELAFDRLYAVVEEIKEVIEEKIPDKKKIYQQLTLFDYGSYNVL